VVVAVESLDIDACHGDAPRDLPELSGHGLTQAQHDHIALRQDGDPGGLERAARRRAVGEEEVGDTAALDGEGAAALDRDAGAAPRLAHGGERAGAIRELDGQVLHGSLPSPEVSTAS